MNSSVLFNRQPLVVNVDLAEKIGLHESIILQQLHYWIEMNKNAKRNFHKGHYWTYNSYSEWGKQFPFWSEITVKRLILKLEKMGLLIVDNFNKLKIDRTKWYRIDYEKLHNIGMIPLYQNDTIKVSK